MSTKAAMGFLGAGRMAAALAKGFIQAKLAGADQVIASDPIDAARSSFARETGAKTTASNLAAVKFAGVLLLAVKPDQVADVLKEIRGEFTENHLLISIAAGVTLARLEGGLGSAARVIRVMPNTPALVGASATAYAPGKNATAEDGRLAQRLFSAIGVAFQLKESLLDCARRREDGPRNRPASGRAQGHGDQPGRHDYRRPARAGKSGGGRCVHERRAGGDGQIEEAGAGIMKTQKPGTENRRKPEIPNPIRNAIRFGLWHLGFGSFSTFDIRISDFPSG